MWKRSSTWIAVEQRLRTTLRNACHMSLATNTIALERSSPSMSKKALKDPTVRSRATCSRRLHPWSIW
jgi:predicted metalloenzyme YecM